jgi:hypothetical protein
MVGTWYLPFSPLYPCLEGNSFAPLCAPAMMCHHRLKMMGLYYVAFCDWDKILEKNSLRRKGLFWLTFSEVSVHGQVALLLCTWGKAEHLDGRSVWWPGSKEKETAWEQAYPSKAHLQWPTSSTGPHLLISIQLWTHQWINPSMEVSILMVITSQQCHQVGTKTSTYEPLGHLTPKP